MLTMMKTVIAICLALFVLSSPVSAFTLERLQPGSEKYGEIAEGMLMGMAASTSYYKISDCLSEIGDKLDIENDKEDLGLGISMKKRAAIKKIVRALTLLQDDITRCTDSSNSDLIRLILAIDALSDPVSIDFKNMIVNGVDINWDYERLQKSWKSKDWEMAGFYVGSIAGKVAPSKAY